MLFANDIILINETCIIVIVRLKVHGDTLDSKWFTDENHEACMELRFDTQFISK